MSTTPQKKKQPGEAAGKAARRDPLASLKLADMMILKPILPAEIIARIVDYLAIPDLMHFALVSRRMLEMVYDDSRWIQRLQQMGCWNEAEARKHTESLAEDFSSTDGTLDIRRKNTMDRSLVNGKGRPDVLISTATSPTSTRRKSSVQSSHKARTELADGFDAVFLSSPTGTSAQKPGNSASALTVLNRVRSIRGLARQEYGMVYSVLGRYYNDVLMTTDLKHCLVFQAYSKPEQQAQMLSQVRTLSLSDFSPGSGVRERKLKTIMDRFNTQALLEFRQGYEYKDIQGKMREYAHVMHTLNGGESSVELFLHDNRLISQKAKLGGVTDCVDYSLGYGQLSLEKIQGYFERLGTGYSQENAIVHAVFPNAEDVSMLLLEAVGDKVLSPFLSDLFDDARARGTGMYLRTVSGTFAAVQQFVQHYGLRKDADKATIIRSNAVMIKLYEPHLKIYLAEELESFKQKADAEIKQWDQALSDQVASTENFLMSNINRHADKKDFMSSFKKVVMMPVNILPNFSGPSNTKTPAKVLANGESQPPSSIPSRSSTPNPLAPQRSVAPLYHAEAPTSELAAKAAVMTSKLENIRSLFSIDVALNLVHAAKSSLERAAQFIPLGGPAGESARAECSAMFVLLVQTIGHRHVKAGFDKAIDSLAVYSPREASTNTPQAASTQVAPLATFLELVNVGDLIQQMLDVFYESELVRLRISNRDDFLDPGVKEKKKFEAMLDERVAAGLGKGIDVLMDEVEYICATTQLPTDFQPAGNIVVDIGPTRTARSVIDVVSGHTAMLTGAADKTLLDVFSAEVGLRLFSTLCKHIKRQRISTAGALPLLSDLTAYANFVAEFKNHDLNSYFTALREVGQLYLIEAVSPSSSTSMSAGDHRASKIYDRDVNEMAAIISDGEKYRGVFTVEEVVEFAERRSDWLLVRSRVEGKIRGEACLVM